VAFRLGISYPGGARLEMLARKGDAGACSLPVPLAGQPGLDFSFSGLKTAAVRLMEGDAPPRRADVAASFQEAAFESLASRVARGLERSGASRLAVVGGVSRNERLRERLAAAASATGANLFACSPELCVDNAAMIAWAARELAVAGLAEAADPAGRPFDVRPRWPLAGEGATPSSPA